MYGVIEMKTLADAYKELKGEQVSELTEQQIIDLFKDAPDDCIGLVQDKDDSPYKDRRQNGEEFVAKGNAHAWEYMYCFNNGISPNMDYFDFIKRPTPTVQGYEIKGDGGDKPVYTQAMCNAGELPSVGMKCLAYDVESIQFIKVTVLMRHKESIVVDIDGWDSAFVFGNSHRFKPLTPPIKLIDGDRYEFELCFGDYRLGYWKEERNSFFDSLLCANKICGKNEATNIKPLTVEGE